MLTKSLFICYSTENYAPISSLCLTSLKKIGVKNLKHKLENPVDLIKTKTDGFRTDIWYYSIHNKIVQLIDVLKANKLSTRVPYFVFTDCDIILFKKKIYSNGDI